ncbi:peptide ABC transporter permease [Microbacterium sp.]|uniref:peptide ABC transporter permease n=1 Tax=Microbacterium sp. TaxID=51671 RepID=UPI002810A3B8|nr:peptide ABC transporter permease [Microbacterium sp.]
MSAPVGTASGVRSGVAPALPRLAAVSWAEVDTGFWVANRAGEYFGCVDAVRGGFVTRDAYNTPVGRYPTLGDAKAAVRSTAHPLNVRGRRLMARMQLTAATAAGLLAGATALLAVTVMPPLS